MERIVAKEYEWECGDGCCYDAGYVVSIYDKGDVFEYTSWSVEEAILEHLGIEVEYEREEE